MRRWAFVVSILGMLVLAGFFVFDVKTADNLEELEINQKVRLDGTVLSEKASYGIRIFELDNGIELVCECNGGFKGKMVFVEGVVSEYKENKQIEVLKIWQEET